MRNPNGTGRTPLETLLDLQDPHRAIQVVWEKPTANGFLTLEQYSEEHFSEFETAFCPRCKMVQLTEYGCAERYVSQATGWNSRLDVLQAAMLHVKLRHLDADNTARGRIAATYSAALAGCELYLPTTRPGSSHVFHFVVCSAEREALRLHLRRAGIAAGSHYPVQVNKQPAYISRCPASPANTEGAANEVLSLPIYPELRDDEAGTVIDAVFVFFEKPDQPVPVYYQ